MHKVLYFQQNPVFGAAEEYLCDLAMGMAAYGYDVHLVYPSLSVTERFRDRTQDSVTLHPVNPVACFSSIACSTIFWTRWFKKLHPTVVHFNDPAIAGSIASAIAGIPVRVVTHHTPELHRRYNSLGRSLERLAFATYVRYVFTSKYSMKTGISRDRLRPQRALVIELGLRPEWYSPLDYQARQQTRIELGLDDRSIMILNPARLSEQKRHDVLLAAARTVTHEHPSTHFFLAGDGELRESIAQQIGQSGLGNHVHLLGHRTDMVRLVTAADIVVMASDFEGLCYAVIEAAAREVPTVATRVGGMRYSVEDGATGILVPPRSPDALAEALLTLIRDPSKRRLLGKAGRERAEQLFTRQRMVEQTAQLYASLLHQ